jgi:hypothetical protein
MGDAVTWPELIVLMAFGARDGRTADEALRGTLHTRETWEVADEGDSDGLAVEEHPALGRLAVSENTVRIARRGSLVRVERPDGTVTAIFGAETTWLFDGREAPAAYDRQRSSFGWAGADIVHRPSPSRWEGDDFTQLTGPIEAVEYLGRPAWAFELAPPRRKPYPVQMVVDSQTGIVLREGNRDFGSVTEWTSLEFDADLPDELFVWDGPTRDPHAELDAEHEADIAERQAWLDARGIAQLPIAVEPALLLNTWDDQTGAFFVSLDLQTNGSLVRRPRSNEPWPEVDGMHWKRTHRWSDERWDWCLAGDFVISDEQLALLRVRLAATT